MLILSSDEKGYSSQIYQNKQGVCLRMKDFNNESCRSCDRISVCWIMHDSGHPLIPDELIVDVMVAGLYHKYVFDFCYFLNHLTVFSVFSKWCISSVSRLLICCWI